MRKILYRIKKKIFATYEYNEKIDAINVNLSNLNEKTDNLLNYSNENISSIINRCDILESKINLISRSVIKKRNKIKVVFLVNNINAWYAISGVIQEMKARENFDVTVASINKMFPGQSDYSGEEDVSNFLRKNNIQHIRLGMKDCRQALDILISINPDVIFRQSQWDVDYPKNLSSRSLSFSRLAIIPYGIANIIKNVNYQGDISDSSVDSEFHRRCWRAYCSSTYTKVKAKKNGSMDGVQFFVSGHPKIDYLKNLKKTTPSKTKNKKQILWSPHHSIYKGWSNFGMFISLWKEMLRIVKANPAIDFIFCPHPALVTQLKSHNVKIENFNYSDFIIEWESSGNGSTYFGAEYAEIVCHCDLIITDGISMLMEGQIINKDILFTERRDHVDFNDIGIKLLDGLFIETEVENIEKSMLSILEGKAGSLNEKQKKIIDELFPITDSHKIICDDIENNIPRLS